ncbi:MULTISPECIES: GPW/gp25 family protein [Thalassomonas]|uniref:GPW/gp25 family protein n=2 Tax=Thalassomonas TaxID=137583 RepID=A0AAE9YPZ9_9GAMM|nr:MULTISPECIES: GPW/gp25 family protein [Thalassomonas]WDD99154.1 GPW/gp25 family protein [Thalassomonas actiniarum]WDE11960.1 GPW/gp25 family protein [Thalassomonas haliotis]
MVFIRTFIKDHQGGEDSPLLRSIKYNLKQLLESEAPLMVLDRDLKACQHSILAYGVEDIQSLNYQLGKGIFITRIKQLIHDFEQRIENLEITILTNEEKQNAIRFIIAGDLVNGQEFQLNSLLNISDFSITLEDELV